MTNSQVVPVTADNFIRAESDLYFSNVVKDGGFGKFLHFRTPSPIEHQSVIRLNRDTLYSAAVFDLDAGPVTITPPRCRQALYVAAGYQRGSIHPAWSPTAKAPTR